MLLRKLVSSLWACSLVNKNLRTSSESSSKIILLEFFFLKKIVGQQAGNLNSCQEEGDGELEEKKACCLS